ncbi:MAG: M48 family metalloprotease [Candidatus Omnitrophica bacterium]|nr:M48 family metalloprotease [Candidatus Omnitrophota bacterium]
MKNSKLFLLPAILLSFVLFSAQAYAASGVAKKIEDKIGLDDNVTLQERVDAIGQKIAGACDRKDIIYTFKVLKDKDINAFALPDGYIYVYRGLVDKTKKDDEIAAVLAHEVAHIAAGHHKERLHRAILANIFSMVAISGASTNADRVNINTAIGELTLSYSREEEIEADMLSAVYLKRAGYDPQAVISMIQILVKSEMSGPIKPYRRWRTHPYLSDRIRAARKEISGNIEFMDYANTPTHGVER